MYFVMDMGTTNTRLWLYDNDNELACVKGAFGARSGKLQGRDFLYGKLRELIFGVLNEKGISERDVECIMVSGMAGSEGGICNIPHISLPAGEMKLAQSVVSKTVGEITSIPFIFVPGLKQMENGRMTDIMRGEETETAGICNALGLRDGAVLVLPGTHNKVIRLNAAGEIVGFQTTMSGEIADIVIKNSILAGSVAHDFDLVEEQFYAGADFAEQNGLNAAVFHVRVMGMDGLGRDELSSFLYGAVFSQDVESIKRFAGESKIYVGGKESLQKIYALLLGDKAEAIPRDVSDFAVRDELKKIYRVISKQNADAGTEMFISEKGREILKSIVGNRLFFLIAPCVAVQNGVIMFPKGKLVVLTQEGSKYVTLDSKWYESEEWGQDYKEFLIGEEPRTETGVTVCAGNAESNVMFEFCEIKSADIYSREIIAHREHIIYDAMIVLETVRGEIIAFEAPADMNWFIHLHIVKDQEKEKFLRRLNREFVNRKERE